MTTKGERASEELQILIETAIDLNLISMSTIDAMSQLSKNDTLRDTLNANLKIVVEAIEGIVENIKSEITL